LECQVGAALVEGVVEGSPSLGANCLRLWVRAATHVVVRLVRLVAGSAGG
jgi:hypothetical protein